MTDYLDPQPGQKVLEIGTGSGYQSAVLSELSNHVYTIEIVDPLARETDAIYRAHEAKYPEFRNIHRKIDDGYYGWPEHAPFDRIIVTCGIDHVPPELLRELAPEGIMVIPVGPPSGQTILRIVKHVDADGTVSLDREDIFQGKRRQIFVPFTSKDGGLHVVEDKKETTVILRPMRLSDTRLAALFLVSVAILGFEIDVMRVFAVASWSNFGSMVISIALLGFGLAGTLLTLLQARVRRAPDAWISSSAFALAPSIALAHAVAQQVPFNPVLIATDPVAGSGGSAPST